MLLSPSHLSESVLQRFHRYVIRKTSDECWPWSGTVASNGYGVLGVGGRSGQTIGAHRLAWVLATQQTIPHRFHICHKCDNPPCCNPAHLFLGTASDNIKDATSKGHKTGKPHPGIKNGMAKMTDDKVIKLRALATQGIPQRRIAAMFGISQTTTWHIINRDTWTHVP